MNKIYQIIIGEGGRDMPTPNTNVLDYYPVIKLGIQGPPGTIFQINNGSDIEIGAYGIYELDFSSGLGKIMDLKIKKCEFKTIKKLIIDIVYEEVVSS